MELCYAEAAETDCAVDQDKPGLKSMSQDFNIIGLITKDVM